MKTLIDFFQAYTLDFELIEDETFGTVALIYFGSTTIPLTPTAPFGKEARDIIEKAGGEVLYFTLYIPRLSDEEVLALTATGNVAPTFGVSVSCLPDAIVEKFTRNERYWFSNYFHDLVEKPDFRSERIERLAFIFAPWVVYGLVKLAF